MLFRSYINPAENREANRKLPKLMVEGLLPGGTGLGVFALIFEIAADASEVQKGMISLPFPLTDDDII